MADVDKNKATLKRIAKYFIFGVLYCFLLAEITFTSGVFDVRSLYWPSTTGQFTYMFTGGRFFACYGYQYQVGDKSLQSSQLLPLAYNGTLKQMQTIHVYYDSNNPEKSFFTPGFNPLVTFVVLFVVFLGFLLLFIPLMSWISVKQKEKS